MGSLSAQECLRLRRETGADGAREEMTTQTLTGWTSAECGAMGRERHACVKGKRQPSPIFTNIDREYGKERFWDLRSLSCMHLQPCLHCQECSHGLCCRTSSSQKLACLMGT